MQIELTDNDRKVFFKKLLWHPSEITLAKCYNFTVNEADGSIVCEVIKTSKKALYTFVKLSFKSFSESSAEKSRRDDFYMRVEKVYMLGYGEVYGIIKSNLPYYDMLYAHQKEVLCEAYFKQYNFFALDMGLGKSISAASLSRITFAKRTVIVCPAAVKYNWYRDLIKFGYNELFFSIYDSSKRRSFKAMNERFVIINYDIVNKFAEEISAWGIDHFIFDEAQNLKNRLSNRSKNIAEWVSKFPDARITFLSGTPVKNRVDDMFSYLKLIRHELGQSYKKFIAEYTITTTNRNVERVTGGRNLNDLHNKLANFMIRRTKEECLDLPDKVYLSYRYEMDDYRDEYNKVIKELSEQKEVSTLTGNIHSLNIITSKAKLKGIIELAETIIEEGRKVVIFGSYTDPIETLAAHFGNRCVTITGSVNSYSRDQLVQRFINDPECTVFIGNMIAAGVGINLVNASDVIFMNFPFTPSELHQAIDRTHRIGQVNSVNVHFTFCDDSIDEYIYDIIISKELDANAVIDNGKDVVLRENTIEILIKKILNKEDVAFKHPGRKKKEVTEEDVKLEEFKVEITAPEPAQPKPEIKEFTPPSFM